MSEPLAISLFSVTDDKLNAAAVVVAGAAAPGRPVHLFDHDNPPKPPKPNRLWHLGKVVFNRTCWHTVPMGRV